MCGIAGWFSREEMQRASAGPRLAAMLDSIRHRGPDGEGTCILPHAALGHVRLAIIDLAGGAQPFGSEDGSCVLSYNGEIYNFKALRAELAAAGYAFRTDSDTEVILALYLREGVGGFRRLRGMFAFALWDGKSQTAFLVRDPCGIKPLFHAECDGRLLFASEAKALVASGLLRPQLDEDGLHQVMNFRYLLGARTLFRGVSQVQPGEVLRWTPGQGLRTLTSLQAAGGDNAGILEVLRESVHSHLVADVEVGVHLSGGVDSAAIVALASETARLRTFTLAIGDDPREADNASATAALFHLDNRRESVGLDVEHQLPRLVWHMEMPKVNALQLYLLAGISARHVKVVLSGVGGDELFYGYNAYRILWQFRQVHGLLAPLRRKEAFNGFGASLLARGYEWNEYDRMRAMAVYGRDWSFIYGLIRNVWDCPAHRAWIYGPRLLDSKPADAFEQLAERWPDDADPVAAARRFEWRNKLVNDLLWQEDRCTMAHGIESRVPFVDAVVEAAMSRYSRAELMPHGRLKWRLRRDLATVLPGNVLNRRKSGFQVDSPAFFSRHLATLAERYLAEDTVREHGLFNPSFVRRMLALPESQRYRWHYFMLYLMIGSHLWLELFEQGDFAIPSAGRVGP